MMVTAAAIGLGAGERLLSSSFSYSDVAEKLSCSSDFTFPCNQAVYVKSVITAKKSSNYSPGSLSSRRIRSIKALKEHVDIALDTPNMEPWDQRISELLNESSDGVDHVEALLLLQKSMLEKQWNLSAEKMITYVPKEDNSKKVQVTCSGTSARQRRIGSRQKVVDRKSPVIRISTSKRGRSIIGTEVLHTRLIKSYVKGVVSEELLTHTEVVQLSKKIKLGLCLEDHKSRLKDRLGCEPSEEQIAISLRTSRADLQATIMECSLAREKLAMSNIRLVMSIAQRYDNMGAEMADLIQGGLIGLLRGIEKFDPSKGFRISTYVYWWIRQGVSKALADNSRMLRLPNHVHERLSLIRNAKKMLEGKGITPSIERIAESLNMSQKKVRNATEAISRVYSLDREAFPSLNGLPGETLHSYIADNHLENNPWHGVDEWALKVDNSSMANQILPVWLNLMQRDVPASISLDDEVKNLICTTLREREGEIIRLYYGIVDNECLTWEDISRRIGLSRERVRQVGLVALEKLKHAARRRKLEAMLIKQ